MKYFFFGTILIALFFLTMNRFLNSEKEILAEKTKSDIDGEQQTEKKNYKEIIINGITYGYVFIKNIQPKQLFLIPNYSEKLKTTELIKEFNCQGGINGGFYGEDNKPLGLVEVKYKKIGQLKKSLLFNAVVAIKCKDNDCQMNIDNAEDTDGDYVLQTGPIMISNGKPVFLELINDKPARRMVMSLSPSQKVSLISIFKPGLMTTGPFLKILPEIVFKISQQESLDIKDSINLDGGMASAFYSKEIFIEETEYVGSWWCLKNI